MLKLSSSRNPPLIASGIASPGNCYRIMAQRAVNKLTPLGFEPTQLALAELESTPLDHSGKVSQHAIGL